MSAALETVHHPLIFMIVNSQKVFVIDLKCCNSFFVLFQVAACNNAAVCLLFMGKVKEASDILETMVCQAPERTLHEEILLNLTTVYELETSRALQKKHKLLDLVSKHKGDGFNVQCLKLT